jgi:hypothetical protein
MSLAGRNTSARMTSVLVIIGLIGGSFFYGSGDHARDFGALGDRGAGDYRAAA